MSFWKLNIKMETYEPTIYERALHIVIFPLIYKPMKISVSKKYPVSPNIFWKNFLNYFLDRLLKIFIAENGPPSLT